MPDWERLTAHIEADPESKEKLGWVREMYAFSVALALQGIKVDLAKPPLNPLITQPPADATLGQAAMFHYTWGSVFQNAQGEKVWEFDKRAYTDPSIVTTVSCPCCHTTCYQAATCRKVVESGSLCSYAVMSDLPRSCPFLCTFRYACICMHLLFAIASQH